MAGTKWSVVRPAQPREAAHASADRLKALRYVLATTAARLREEHGARLGRVGQVGLVLARGGGEHGGQQRRQLRHARVRAPGEHAVVERGERRLQLVKTSE